jgi:hypothetical protein
MPLVSIEPYAGDVVTFENALNRPGAAQTGDKDVGRGAVAVDDRPSDEVVDDRVKSVSGHQLGQRLDRETQILFSNDNVVSKRPTPMVDSIHDRDANQQLHDTLKGESLLAIHA